MSVDRKTKVSCRWLPTDADASQGKVEGAQKAAMKVRVDMDAQVLLCYGFHRSSRESDGGSPQPLRLLRSLSLKTASAGLPPGSDRVVCLWASDPDAKRIVREAEARAQEGGDEDSSSEESPAAEEVEGTFQFKCADEVEAACLLDKIQQAGCIMRGLRRRYDIKEQVGYGGFSKVFSAVDKLTGATVAIKLCSKIGKTAHPLKESLVLRQLRHPSLLDFKGVYQIADPELLKLAGVEEGCTWALVTDLLRGKELHEVALTRELSEVEARLVFGRLLSALHCIHEHGIVHRDVKPENVVVTPKGVKLIDFGLACHEDDAEGIGLKVGSAGYVAPELLHGTKEDRTTKMDCFAMGSLLYFILCRRSPFEHDDETTVWANNVKGNVNAEPLEEVSADAADLIMQLLTGDHEERLSAQEAMRHPWLMRGWNSAPTTPQPPSKREARAPLEGHDGEDMCSGEDSAEEDTSPRSHASGSGLAAVRSQKHHSDPAAYQSR